MRTYYYGNDFVKMSQEAPSFFERLYRTVAAAPPPRPPSPSPSPHPKPTPAGYKWECHANSTNIGMVDKYSLKDQLCVTRLSSARSSQRRHGSIIEVRSRTQY